MSAETGAKWVLRFITLTTVPAFVAAVMPQRWLVFGLNSVEPGYAPGTGLLAVLVRRVPDQALVSG